MGLNLTKGEEFFEFQYNKLSIRCVQGRLDKSLEELAELYVNDPIEFAPVRQEVGRYFLAGIYFEPPADVTVDKLFDGETTIVVYSLNHDRCVEVVNNIMERSGFSAFKPEQSFIDDIKGEMMLEMHIYHSAEQIAEIAEVSFEKAWGAVRYSNFLRHYKGYSETDSIREAMKRFGIDDMEI
jgi:hypothetical protein